MPPHHYWSWGLAPVPNSLLGVSAPGRQSTIRHGLWRGKHGLWRGKHGLDVRGKTEQRGLGWRTWMFSGIFSKWGIWKNAGDGCFFGWPMLTMIRYDKCHWIGLSIQTMWEDVRISCDSDDVSKSLDETGTEFYGVWTLGIHQNNNVTFNGEIWWWSMKFLGSLSSDPCTSTCFKSSLTGNHPINRQIKPSQFIIPTWSDPPTQNYIYNYIYKLTRHPVSQRPSPPAVHHVMSSKLRWAQCLIWWAKKPIWTPWHGRAWDACGDGDSPWCPRFFCEKCKVQALSSQRSNMIQQLFWDTNRHFRYWTPWPETQRPRQWFWSVAVHP